MRTTAVVTVTLACWMSLGLITPTARATLVAYYSFDDHVLDLSGNGNDGTLVGDANFVAGMNYDTDVPGVIGFGKSMQFNNAGNVVEVADVTYLDGRSEATFAAWIKGTDFVAGGRNFPVSKDNSFEFGIRNQQITMRVSNGWDNFTTQVAPVVPLDQWHHIAAVYNGAGTGTVDYYVDGAFLEQVSLDQGGVVNENSSLSFNDTTNLLYLGNRTPGDDKDFRGWVDDVAIWDSRLEPFEVGQLAQGVAPYAIGIPEPSGLLLGWTGLAAAVGIWRRRRWPCGGG